jgi:hypothetical protein
MNWIDYIVLALILLVPILIGLFFGYLRNFKCFKKPNDEKKQTELAEYLVASSDMGAIPIAFSLFATFVSTSTFLGN